MLALFYVLIDVTHFWSGAPPKYVGMNSIVVYVHEYGTHGSLLS